MLLTLICLGFFSLHSFGQTENGKIIVSVTDEKGSPFESASILLLRGTDSSVLKSSLPDANGVAVFENIIPGEYLLRISAAGFAEYYSTLIRVSLDNPVHNLPIVKLQPRSTSLKEVTVTAKKPFIQKLSDRLVVNVENSIISAGSSAMDVLERSPGVNVNQNDVISLRGKQGVIIMVDGKPSNMTGADLANYLRGLPSAALDRIDIITNPSAKYDAAGNSGIIDLRMKKDQRLGVNGTATMGYGQGIYPKANAGATFNYRNKKINVFGNYNYSYRVGLNHLFLDRNFYENGVYQGGDLKDNYSKSPFSNNTARLGMDFFASKKTIIGFVINGNFNSYKRNADNNSIVIDDQKLRASTFRSLATNDDHGRNIVGNLNFKHTFDSSGRELSVDLDYGSYRSSSITRNASQYFKVNGETLQPDYILDGDQDGKLNFKTAKLDFTNPLKGNAKLEAGFKTSFVSSDNDAKFFDMSSGVPQNDVNKTNHFLYKETNNAGYLNFSKEFKKFDIQAGLRGEHTSLKTDQRIGAQKFDSSYFQLFPSAFFNYHVKEDQTIGISVSRRIDRPGYSQLNPFLFLIDPTTYATGRPGLRPQLTWSYELSYTLKKINFALNYSHTRDNQNVTLARFTEVFPNIPSPSNVTVQVPINLSSSDYFGLSISAPVQLTKWWTMVNNADVYYQKFNGKFSGTNLDRGKPAADLRTNNSFTFKKGWAAELNANLNTGGQDGFMVAKPQWALSAGVQKSVLKNKGTVRLNITDIFWTNLPRATITYDNYVEKWRAERETRVANLSFTYKFGNNKVQAARRRTTGSEEERQRAQ